MQAAAARTTVALAVLRMFSVRSDIKAKDSIGLAEP